MVLTLFCYNFHSRLSYQFGSKPYLKIAKNAHKPITTPFDTSKLIASLPDLSPEKTSVFAQKKGSFLTLVAKC